MLKRVKVNAPQANLVPYGYEIEAADEDDQKDDEPAMGGPDVEAQLLMLREDVYKKSELAVKAQEEYDDSWTKYILFYNKHSRS